jgi:hypothetical protein
MRGMEGTRRGGRCKNYWYFISAAVSCWSVACHASSGMDFFDDDRLSIFA